MTSLSKAKIDFNSMDTNEDGKVNKEEFRAALTATGNFTEQQVSQIVEDWGDRTPRSSKSTIQFPTWNTTSTSTTWDSSWSYGSSWSTTYSY